MTAVEESEVGNYL